MDKNTIDVSKGVEMLKERNNRPVSKGSRQGATGNKVSEVTLNKTQIDAMNDYVSKAFTAGYDINPATQRDGGALKVESLDTQLKQWTYSTQNLTLYADLLQQGVIKSNSTVLQYPVLEQHGRVGHSQFQPEIGLTNVTGPNLRKKSVNMKYLTQVMQVSYPMQYTSTFSDVDTILLDDAVTALSKTIEWAAFYGDASLSGTEGDGQEGLEFDGLSKLIDADNHFDVRGAQLTPELFNRAATTIGERGFGEATDAYMPISAYADFSNQFLGAQRISMNASTGQVSVGNVANEFVSVNGNVRLHSSAVMQLDNVLPERSIRLNAETPAPPLVKAEVVKDAGGKFMKKPEDPKADYDPAFLDVGVEQSYKVVLVNNFGDSLPSQEVKATPTDPTDGVKLTISFTTTAKGGITYAAVYRKCAVDNKYYLIKRVPKSEVDDQGQIIFTDLDETIPGTVDIFIGEKRQYTIGLVEFIPMCLLPFAPVNTASQSAVYWGGALALYRPKCWVQLHNVRTTYFAPLNENHMNGVNVYGYGATR